MAVDHTGTTRPRCVILSDDDMAALRRIGKGNRSEGIRRLVRLYLTAKRRRARHER